MTKLIYSRSINVAIVENNAYWVYDNIFYTAKIDSAGIIDTQNATPIDVFSLSENETKNLLKILDSLSEN